MRGFVPGYDVTVPATLDQALALLSESPGEWTPIAGATDIMVYMESGALPSGLFLSLWQLDELRGVDVTAEAVTLGALTTYADVRDNPLMQAEFPMLVQAARESGAIAIQNRGTLGGNIVNASPAADSPPALIAYDAEIELVSASGSRWVAYRDFHTGYKVMDRRPDELLRAIRLKRRADPAAWTHFYWKVGTRRFQAISKVCFAGLARVDAGVVRDVAIGLGSIAPTVVKAVHAEAALEGATLDAALDTRVAEAIRKDVAPIDDIRSTARYRAKVSENLACAFVTELRKAHG